MNWIQTAAIWLLCAMLAVTIAVGIILYLQRDTNQPRRPLIRQHAGRRARPPIVATWQRESVTAILDRWRARAAARRSGYAQAGGTSPADIDAPSHWRAFAAEAEARWREAGAQAAERIIRDWYARREEALTQQLLDAGAARWHS